MERDWSNLVTRLEGPLPGNLDELAEAVRRQWEERAPGEAAERFYRQRLFPVSCERMRMLGRGRGPFALCFIPVGTQPFAPILAGLASPAERTILVHTRETTPEAHAARDALAEDRRRVILRSMGTGTDVARAVEIIEGEYAAAGFPAPDTVVIDLTGGRKAMSAALASVASLHGFRQAYIEGQPSGAHRGFVSGERFVELPSVTELLGAGERRVALALLRAGAFRAAAAVFRELGRSSGAAAADLCLAAASEGWDAWERLAWKKARTSFRRAARLAPVAAAGALLEDLAALAGGAESGVPGIRAWLAAGVALDARGRGQEMLARGVAAAARLPASRRDPAGLRALQGKIPPLGDLSRRRLSRLGRPSRAVEELLRALGAAVGPR